MTDADEKLAKIKAIFETVVCEDDIIISDHAYWNLEGAMLSIEWQKGHCDPASMNTLTRVSAQLAAIALLLDL